MTQNSVSKAYIGMVEEASTLTKKTPTDIIKEAKDAMSETEDYSSDPEIVDLIENYSKADLIQLIVTLSKSGGR